MFALDMVMIHHICLMCNEPSTPLSIFVKRWVNQLLQLKFLNANGYYVWNKGSVPMFHIFWIFFLNFYCSGQTFVNYGQRRLAHISGARYWAFTLNKQLIWCDNVVYFVGTDGLQCFAMYFWHLLYKKDPLFTTNWKITVFLNNSCNSQCEDSLSCQDAPMCQILDHLGNVCLGYGHDPSYLPYVKWTFYPVVHICEEMSKSVAVTQVS